MEPSSPLRPPDTPAPAESPLAHPERTGDSHGQSFRFWGKPPAGPPARPPGPPPASGSAEDAPVELNLSTSARQALARRKRKGP